MTDSQVAIGFVIGGALVLIGLLLEQLGAVKLPIPRFSEPYRLVNIVFLLRFAERYALPLELLVLRTHFGDPTARSDALGRLVEMIDVDDVVDGFYEVDAESWAPRWLAWQARKQFREQSALAGVDFRVLNEGGHVTGRSQIPDQSAEGQALVLGMSISVQGLASPYRGSNLAKDLVGLLRASADSKVGDQSFLGFWFTPLHGEAMPPEEAKARFDQVLASTI